MQGSLALEVVPENAPIGALDEELWRRGFRFLLGLDEVGRGPLAGPVTAAGVLLEADAGSWCAEGLNDSKALSERQRERWAERVRAHARAWTVEHGSVELIDELNILGASLHCMRCCAERLLDEQQVDPGEVLVLVDGKQLLRGWTRGAQLAVVRGDARSWAIAGASVLAKVERDAELTRLDTLHPGYGLAQHKGYPTPAHLAALERLGVSAVHRRSFAPVRRLLVPR